MNRKIIFIIFLCSLAIVSLIACGNNIDEKAENKMEYKQISQEEAKKIMDTQSGFIIVDVREQDEFDAGHIKDAILMPYESTAELAPKLLPNKDQMILVYCRSGRRSKIAAQTLANMGYSNVLEFGGIITWTYGIVTE